ncbi:MAG: molybdopterin-dependent oxidoreductase [Desulfobacteraceae bacterium]
METISLSINGKNLTCQPGISVLDAAVTNGFPVPTLCHHPDLKPHGACRLCIVEDANSGRLYASCVTPVADNMSVLTHSPRVVAHRRTIVGLMLAAHPESCLVCSKGNDCDLRRIAGELGLGANIFYPMPKFSPQDQSNPFIFRDTSKCILCGKCIRGCKELVVNGTLEYSDRGFQSKPQTVFDTTLESSDCTFCGTCVNLCPTGALVPSSAVYFGTAAKRHESVCGFCGTGCRVSLGVSGDRICDVKPSAIPGSVNGVTACVRGLFALDYLESGKRLQSAMKRSEDGFVPVPLREAIIELAETLKSVKEKYGPDSIGFYGSSKCSNEENYLFQKIAREGIGTPHIDNGGALYGRDNMEIFDRLTFGTFRKQSMADLANAQAIILMGADTSVSSPVLGYHIKRAVRGGATLIILNQKKSNMTLHGALWMKPGFTVDTMDSYANMIQAVSEMIAQQSISGEASEPSTIGKTAALIKGKSTAMIIGEDVLESPKGGQVIAECVNLHRTVHQGTSEAGGMYLIARENNLIGSWDMGTVPNQQPGRTRVAEQGMGILDMISAAESGRLKALYIMGENPLRNLPQPENVRRALEKLEFLVVQDILETETTAAAHMILPGAAFAEKSGSFTSMEGRVQTFSRAIDPPGDAISDYNLLCRLADLLGVTSGTMEAIRVEIGDRVPAYRELATNPLYFWPKWKQLERNVAMDDRNVASVGSTATQRDNGMNEQFPYFAMIHTSHFHAGSGTRTALSARVTAAKSFCSVTVSPSLAKRHSLREGVAVRVMSEHGSVTQNLALDPTLDDKVVAVPDIYNGNEVLNLFGKSSVGRTRCRVRIEAVGEVV